MAKKIGRFVTPLLMWIIVIVGIILLLNYVSQAKLFNPGVFGSIIFIMTLIYWLYFFISSIIVHRKAALSVSQIDKIIKSGPYSNVRHPIYSADIVLALGVFFAIPRLDILLSIIWLFIILISWMFLEENFLIKKFGKEYIDYKRKVPMFFPGLKKHV